jgi:hypothetical protein
MSHNGHLIPLTRLLTHADLAWSLDGALPTAVALLATGLAALLLWLPVRGSGIEPAGLRRTIGAFLAFCLIYSALTYGVLWGFSAHAPLMAAWLALAVAALIAFAAEEPPRRRTWQVALAVAGATGASLACATGVGAWAALLAIAVYARLPLRIGAAIAAGAAACVLLIAVMPRLDGYAASAVSPWLGRPDVMARFVFRYLGSPFAWPAASWLGVSEAAGVNLAFCVGAVALAGCGVHAALQLRAGRIADRAGLLGLALMAFGVAAAGLTAVGRAGLFPPVNQRFTPFALVFWMGAVVAAAGSAGRAGWRGRARNGLALLLPVVSLVFLHSLGPHLDQHRERRARVASSTQMLAVGIRSEGIPYVLSGGMHARVVVEALPDLEARGLGPFDDPRRDLLGEPLAAAGITGAPPRCAGLVRKRTRLSKRRGSGESLEGFLHAAAGQPLAVSLVVTDPDGTIRGFGNVLPPEQGKAEWYAHRAPPVRGTARVYALLEGGSACVLGGRR